MTSGYRPLAKIQRKQVVRFLRQRTLFHGFCGIARTSGIRRWQSVSLPTEQHASSALVIWLIIVIEKPHTISDEGFKSASFSEVATSAGSSRRKLLIP